MTWLSSGRITNPAIDALLLDTGALIAGSRTPQIMISSTVAAAFELQYRDAANAVTLKSQIIACGAFDVQSVGFSIPLDMLATERLRVLAVGTIVGVMSVSIHYQP